MALSLRQRLFMIIVLPLLLIAVAAGVWRVAEARSTAQDVFDRSLLFTAVAVARDVALLDGDAISLETQSLLGDAAGGPIRYHVYAPDGAFVTGYATPPVPIEKVTVSERAFTEYDGTYKGRDVRVLRLLDVSQIGGLNGTFTITVWQDNALRQGFAREIALRSAAVMAALIGAVALCVWFGVNLGLKPLLDLEEAISRRTPDDLTPIRRRVPAEAVGIVSKLNTLIGQIQSTMSAQNAFISDAAHQLRNPLAGIRALGDSILTANSLDTAKSRARDLVGAATQASDLANRLLQLERLRAGSGKDEFTRVDLGEIVAECVAKLDHQAADQNVSLTLINGHELHVMGDAILLREALINLLTNALVHGGPELSEIIVRLSHDAASANISVSDDGKSIAAEDTNKVMARFGQAQHGQGSGLGLPIADAVAKQHGGTLALDTSGPGFSVTISLPLA